MGQLLQVGVLFGRFHTTLIGYLAGPRGNEL